jgi:hypothetical protein
MPAGKIRPKSRISPDFDNLRHESTGGFPILLQGETCRLAAVHLGSQEGF